MKNPDLAGDIVAAIRKRIKKPVTVKIRRGFDDQQLNCVEMARTLESAGASAIAVHGRTREQLYAGKADWDCIRQVKEAVSIPVIGNGDVDSPEKAKALMEETGCDGIMIGRGAQGNPWLFSRVIHYLETGELLPAPSSEEVIEMVLRHSRMLAEYKGDYTGIREMRKHVAWYTAGFRHSAKLRQKVNEVTSLEELEQLIRGKLTEGRQ